MNPNLPPRTAALLCCLRECGRSRIDINYAIGDGAMHDTHVLLDSSRRVGLVGRLDSDGLWYLDQAGVEWLSSHGLVVQRGAYLRSATSTCTKETL